MTFSETYRQLREIVPRGWHFLLRVDAWFHDYGDTTGDTVEWHVSLHRHDSGMPFHETFATPEIAVESVRDFFAAKNPNEMAERRDAVGVIESECGESPAASESAEGLVVPG